MQKYYIFYFNKLKLIKYGYFSCMLTMMTICIFDCVFTQNLLKCWILDMKSSKLINYLPLYYNYLNAKGRWNTKCEWWMNEIPGLVMDNEVFDDAKGKVCWDSWMNGIPDLVWSIKFLIMEKSSFGIHGWMIYTWFDLDNEVFWWEWRKVSWNRMNEWIASLIWTMKFCWAWRKLHWDSWMNEIPGLVWTMKF